MAEHINVIHPHYEDDPDDARVEAFWAAVASDPMMVVLVEAVATIGPTMKTHVTDLAVFANYDDALKHAKGLHHEGAVLVPKRIGEPRWGNATVN